MNRLLLGKSKQWVFSKLVLGKMEYVEEIYDLAPDTYQEAIVGTPEKF